MDFNLYLQFLLALVFVLALIGLVAALARRFGIGYGTAIKRGAERRLAVSEMLPLDGKRRLILVRRDWTEHLVILGPNTETLIEAAIPAPGTNFADALRHSGAIPDPAALAADTGERAAEERR